MRQTISSALAELARREPDALAVIAADGRLSRASLGAEASRCARILSRRGVGPDDIVTVLLPNGAAHVIACCAIWMLGATPHPLSPRLPSAEQSDIVRIAGSTAIIVADGASGRVFSGLEVLEISELWREGPSREGAALPVDLAAVSWKASSSSGSTGRPKIVVAAGSAHVDPDVPVTGFLPLSAIQLVVAPLSHAAPFTYAMRGLMTGHTLVIHEHFDAAAVLDAIAAHRISWVMLTPTMMHRIRRLPDELLAAAELGSLETVLHIGAPIALDLKHWWIELLGPERIIEVYSGSESSGLTVIRGDEWLEHPGSVGRPAVGTELRIVGEDGAPLPSGRIGLIQLRKTAGVAYRYLGADSRADDTGWDTLGDDGRLDADGYLWVVDRAEDRLRQHGSTFYPIELEQAIERHPAVRSAVVTGSATVDGEHDVHATVDVADSDITAQQIADWLHERLDTAKWPRSISLVNEPVRDDAGKVRRSAYRPAFRPGA